MTLPAWLTLALSIPVLLVGEIVVRRIGFLSRFNIPAPVAGGLAVSALLLLLRVTWMPDAALGTKTTANWWNWIVVGPGVNAGESRAINLPFLVAFFTCIGLNASWTLLRHGALRILKFLAAAGVLAVLQNLIGVSLAKLLGLSPLLGLVCGSLSLTGGHGTALGFAGELEKAGLTGAAGLGMAAATFGLVAGGLIGGPVGGWLILKRNLQSTACTDTHLEAGRTDEPGIVTDILRAGSFGLRTLFHLLVVLICIKVGAWFSLLAQYTQVTFPVYMGAMVFAAMVRNSVDLIAPGQIRKEIVDTLGSVFLGVFLSTALMSLNLAELMYAALPMVLILGVQVGFMALFACFVTFFIMGRDFEAAVITGGHCGFALGATPNAIANMKALVERFGPAPEAFLVVPVVGAFLVDFLNAINNTLFLNLLT